MTDAATTTSKQTPRHPEPADQGENGSPLKAIRKNGRLVIQADEEIEIICGKSSLIMKKDGTIYLRGDNLTSRATGRNRVQGAIIELN